MSRCCRCNALLNGNAPFCPACGRAQVDPSKTVDAPVVEPGGDREYCPRCGRPNLAGSTFCSWCQWHVHTRCKGTANLEARCPKCGRRLPFDARFCPDDSFDLDAWFGATPLPKGYVLLEVLSEGARGRVFRARNELTAREVVVKTFTGGSNDEEAHTALAREVEATSALDHPNVVVVRHADPHATPPYLVTDFVAGETVRQRMARLDEPLSAYDVLTIARDVATGLAYAHAHGVVHGDLKPENVLRGDDGIARIVDFGVSDRSSGGGGRSKADRFMGTPRYLAPEQREGLPATTATDVFALGLVLTEMIDSHAFARCARSTALRSPAASTGRIPVGLQSLVAACVSNDPARRPSALDVARAFDHLLAEPLKIPEPTARYDSIVDAALLLVAIVTGVAGVVVLAWG